MQPPSPEAFAALTPEAQELVLRIAQALSTTPPSHPPERSRVPEWARSKKLWGLFALFAFLLLLLLTWAVGSLLFGLDWGPFRDVGAVATSASGAHQAGQAMVDRAAAQGGTYRAPQPSPGAPRIPPPA